MNIIKLSIVIIFTLCFITVCASSGNYSPFGSAKEDAGTVKINYSELHQVIDGFGGSNAWTRLPSFQDTSTELVKLLFSRTEGMGFTILRNRIPFREGLPGDKQTNNDGFLVRKEDHTYSYTVNADGTKTFELDWDSWDLASTKNLINQIKNLGSSGPEQLVIMSAPWTPPNNRVTQWKEDVTGVSRRSDYKMDYSMPDRWGRLKRAHYNDYADLLADYVSNFESKMGHPLSILSVQNEPNWKADWECCYWSGTDLRDFIKIISQRFPMKGIKFGNDGIGIMMPEFENFNIDYNDMIKPSIEDPVSEKIITHIALHQYNAPNDASSRAGSMEFPDILKTGKRFWQTEVSGSGTHLPKGNGIHNALFYARMIHWDMTLSQTNAFLYWWLWTNNKNDDFPGALIRIQDDEITASHRLYVMGQYSRFIRPGWRRIESTAIPSRGAYSSSYRNPDTKEIAVVIVNETISPFVFTLDLSGAEFERLEAWRTSENETLKSLGGKAGSGNKFTVTSAPLSVTTFYGKVK